MRLKYLELYGFKSFADKTRLEFDDDFVAIVGPNGSGKSNTSDAVRWVLGEGSAKALRGAKMEDVIFSGTEGRAPMNLAQVTIGFDNRDGSIPLPYEEVAVSRKVYRSGESEYLINKASVRRKDVRELFLDTGIGKEGYSLIGQGRIEDILSSRSEDRRDIFEEAAGIAKYKYQKVEAQRRLERTEKSLETLEAELKVKDQQGQILKKQAENAKRGVALTTELERHELSLLHAQRKAWREKRVDAEADLKKIEADEADAQKRIEALEQELAPHRERLEAYESKKERLFSESEQEKARLSSAESVSRVGAEKEVFLGRELERLDEDAARASLRGERAGKELEEWKERREALAAEKSSLEKERAGLEASASTGSFDEKAYSELLARRDEASEKLKYLEYEQRTKSELDRTMSEEKKSLEKQLQAQEAEYQKILESGEEIVARLERVTEEIETTEREMKACEAGIEEETRRSAERATRRSKLESERSGLVSRRQMLQSLIESYDGYFKQVQMFLRAADREPSLKKRFVGVLADLIRVDAPYETAVDVSLGSALQNIVVENEEDAKFLIAYLKRNRLGRITFLPINRIHGPAPDRDSSELVLCNATEAVHADPAYENIVRHFLSRTLFTRTIDDAVTLSRRRENKSRIVTLEGDIVNTSGSMVGGSIPRKSGAGLLNRKEELERIVDSIRSTEEALSRLREEEERMSLRRSEEERRKEELRTRLTLDRRHAEELRKEAAKAELDRRVIEERMDSVRASAQKESGYSEEEFERKKAELRALLKPLEEAAERETAAREAFRKASEETERALALLNGKLEFNAREASIAENRLAEAEERLEEARATAEADEKRRAEILGERKENAAAIEHAEEKARLARAEIDRLELERQTVISEEKELRGTLSEQTDEIERLRREASERGNERYRIEMRLEQIDAQERETIERYREQYDLSLEDVYRRLERLDPIATTRKRVAEIKQELSKIGFFNFESIEEYDRLAEELEFLHFQVDDLKKSKADILTLITDLDRTMVDLFKDSFRKINEKYDEIFRILFGGGHAELMLDSKDVLTAGIEIAAQPPGKKLQSLGLLSGGERSMTAMALLFAIFSIRPTPFCILDEIDAALDEANIGRYVRYLQTLTEMTQFIVITHRKTTMELAEMLYGVTMEAGVSKVLTLRLDEYGE